MNRRLSTTLRRGAAIAVSVSSPSLVGFENTNNCRMYAIKLPETHSHSAVPGQRAAPPPPPNFVGQYSAADFKSSAASVVTGFVSPTEVLDHMVLVVPSYYVPLKEVAKLVPREIEELCSNKYKFPVFVKKYRMFFDLKPGLGGAEMKLKSSLKHAHFGLADDKYEGESLGEDTVVFRAKREYVRTSQFYTPPREKQPPPEPRVRQPAPEPRVRQPPSEPKARVPRDPGVQTTKVESGIAILHRLKGSVPTEFRLVSEVEAEIPPDLLFHPFFETTNGLMGIGKTYPEHLQIVDDKIRVKPDDVAPLSLADFVVANSPDPDLLNHALEILSLQPEISGVRWCPVNDVYAKLSVEQRRYIRNKYKSLTNFIRMHGKSLAVSPDTTRFRIWSPPAPEQPPVPPSQHVRVQPHIVAEELHEVFPRTKTLTLSEAIDLLPSNMQAVANKDLGAFIRMLDSLRQYFTVARMDEDDPGKSLLHRKTSDLPVDVISAFYKGIEKTIGKAWTAEEIAANAQVAANENPDDGAAGIAAPLEQVLQAMNSGMRGYIQHRGVSRVVATIPEWIKCEDGLVYPLQTVAHVDKVAKGQGNRRGGGSGGTGSFKDGSAFHRGPF